MPLMQNTTGRYSESWSRALGAGSFTFGAICGIWGLAPFSPLVLAPVLFATDTH